MTDDLLYFDCESTGADPIADRLTEVSVVRADGTVVFHSLVHPGRPIPPEVQALTGITDEMVTAPGVPLFHEIAAQALAERAPGQAAVPASGAPSSTCPLLAEEFERAGVAYSFGAVLDVGHLYKVLRPRTLAAAVRPSSGRRRPLASTGRRTGRRPTPCAVADVLGGMRYADPRVSLAPAVSDLIALSRGDRPERADPAGRLLRVNGVVCFGTHRNKGVPVADDVAYAEWMLRQGFPLSTQRVLREELKRIEDERAAAAEARLEAALANDGGGMTDLAAGDVDRIPF
jgi:DNA polymerase III subunit epsilon